MARSDDIATSLMDQQSNDVLSTEGLFRVLGRNRKKLTPESVLDAWRSGKIYTSQVEYTPKGYMPASDCKWSAKRKEGFFGYDSQLGVYQISTRLDSHVTLNLEATITLGNSAVCLGVAPDQDQFAIGDNRGQIGLGSLSKGVIYDTLKTDFTSRVWTLDYSPNGDLIAAGHQNGKLVLWNNTGEIVGVQEAKDWVRSVSFSPDGQYLLTSHKFNINDPARPVIRRWSIDPFMYIGAYFHHRDTVWYVKHLADGSGFVSGGTEKTVSYFKFGELEPVFNKKKHTGVVILLAVHPFGGVFASGAWTGSIKIWELETGDDVRTIEAHSVRVYALDFSKSGRFLVSGGKDSQIAVWKMPEGIPVTRILAHGGWVRSVRFITDDTLLSIGSEGLCKIWRLKSEIPEVSPAQLYASPQDVIRAFRSQVFESEEND